MCQIYGQHVILMSSLSTSKSFCFVRSRSCVSLFFLQTQSQAGYRKAISPLSDLWKVSHSHLAVIACWCRSTVVIDSYKVREDGAGGWWRRVYYDHLEGYCEEWRNSFKMHILKIAVFPDKYRKWVISSLCVCVCVFIRMCACAFHDWHRISSGLRQRRDAIYWDSTPLWMTGKEGKQQWDRQEKRDTNF